MTIRHKTKFGGLRAKMAAQHAFEESVGELFGVTLPRRRRMGFERTIPQRRKQLTIAPLAQAIGAFAAHSDCLGGGRY